MSFSIQESATPDRAGAPGLIGARPRGVLTVALRSRKAVIGILVLLVIAGAALLAPRLAPYPVTEMHATDRFSPPGGRYPLGTDFFGRDLFSRILFGYRTSLLVAALSVAFALVTGSEIGRAHV